jgi:hypothetical protein
MSIDDNADVGAATAARTTSGTQVSRDGGFGPSPQRLRIHVPTGDSEMTLGLNNDGHLGVRARTTATVYREAKSHGVTMKSQDEGVLAATSLALGVNDKGFVGVLSVADHGNIFLCATGQADLGGSYATASRVGIMIETGIAAIRSVLQAWGSHYHKGQASGLNTALTVGQTALSLVNAATSPMSGGSTAGLGNLDYLKTGHVALFGARTVKLESIEAVTSSAALFNSHSAGLSASLNSIVSATVNGGILAGVNAGYGASMNAQSATVVGGVDAGISARVGTTRVEGQSIRIGNRKQAGAKAKYLSGIQEQTEDLWMRAASFIELGVPSTREAPEMPPATWAEDGHLVGLKTHPNGMQIMRGSVRITTNKAAVKLTNEVVSTAGESIIKVGPRAVEIGRLLVAPNPLTTAQLDIARLAYHAGWAASEGIVKQLEAVMSKARAGLGWGTIASVGAFAAGVGAAAAAGAGAGFAADGDSKGASTGAIVGSTIGAVGILTGITLVAMKAAGKVQRAGQKLAQKAYVQANRLALMTEGATTILDPLGPKIQVKDGKIILAVGPMASITISEDSIKIAGLSVKINDMEMGPGIPPPPPPPIMPEVEPPPLEVGGPEADSFLAQAMSEAGF